jgi:hypothetical protein
MFQAGYGKTWRQGFGFPSVWRAGHGHRCVEISLVYQRCAGGEFVQRLLSEHSMEGSGTNPAFYFREKQRQNA